MASWWLSASPPHDVRVLDGSDAPLLETCSEPAYESVVPCVLDNTAFVRRWPLWNKSLAFYANVPAFRDIGPFNVTMQRTRAVLYRRQDAHSPLVLPLEAGQAEFGRVSMDAVVERLQRIHRNGPAAATEHMYASLPIGRRKAAVRLVQPHDALLPPLPFTLNAVLLWLGSDGVTATPHYDNDENFVVQLRGAKRWSFWRPDAPIRHTLYPAVSNYGRQCRREAFDAPAQYEWVLRAGQVLFVPACWLHRVECVASDDDACVSVNFWLEGPATALEDKKEALARVAEQHMQQLDRAGIDRRVSVLLYVRMVLEAASLRACDVMRAIARDQYEPLMGAATGDDARVCDVQWVRSARGGCRLCVHLRSKSVDTHSERRRGACRARLAAGRAGAPPMGAAYAPAQRRWHAPLVAARHH